MRADQLSSDRRTMNLCSARSAQARAQVKVAREEPHYNNEKKNNPSLRLQEQGALAEAVQEQSRGKGGKRQRRACSVMWQSPVWRRHRQRRPPPSNPSKRSKEQEHRGPSIGGVEGSVRALLHAACYWPTGEVAELRSDFGIGARGVLFRCVPMVRLLRRGTARFLRVAQGGELTDTRRFDRRVPTRRLAGQRRC